MPPGYYPQHPGMGGLGNLPFGYPIPAPPERVLHARYGTGGEVVDCKTEQERLEQDMRELQRLYYASGGIVWWNQPTPLHDVPFRGRVEELFARAVINVGGGSATDADADTGATAMAAAESAYSGDTINVLEPTGTTDYVTVLTFTVPKGSALTVRSVGTWGHDYGAVRDLIKWRVRGGGRVLVAEREMGLLGSLDNPVLVASILREQEVLTVEARNVDVNSASLVEVRVVGWTYPVSNTGNDTLGSILPQYTRNPRDGGRFAPGAIPGGPCDPFGTGGA